MKKFNGKSKIILGSIAILTFILSIVSYQQFFGMKSDNTKNQNEIADENNKNNAIENANNKQIINISSSFDLAYDLNDSKVMYDLSEYIAIVKIDSIDGTSNFNKITNKYISHPYTYGTATVLKMLKGNIKSSTFNFIRTGGLIAYDDYVKGDIDPNKLESVRKEYGTENISTKDLYVDYKVQGDIEIEKGKLYLVYMSHNSNFNTENEYNIFGYQFGLREIQQSSNLVNSIQKDLDLNLKVKNNITNQWVKLQEVLDLNEKK